MGFLARLFGRGEKEAAGGGEKETCEGCGRMFPKEDLLTISTMSPGGSSTKRLCKKCKVKHIMGLAGR